MAEIKNIAVVDDREENRVAAANAIAEVLPSAHISMYSSATEFIRALGNNPTDEIDIVLSDMKMEDENAGQRVAAAAWSWNIPTVIVSGGLKDHGRSQVAVSFPLSRCIFGEKSDHRVWYEIVSEVLRNGTILRMVKWGKRKTPDIKHGETCANFSVSLLQH